LGGPQNRSGRSGEEKEIPVPAGNRPREGLRLWMTAGHGELSHRWGQIQTNVDTRNIRETLIE